MKNDILMIILPILVLVGWALLLTLVDLWIPLKRKAIVALLAAAGLAATLGFTLAQGRLPVMVDSTVMVITDGFALFLDVIFLVSGMVGIALAYDYLKRMGIQRGEYYTLMLFSISGMMMMAHSENLITLFLSLELLSIPLYILAGFAHPRPESEESALKYFLMGAFASGFVLYGTALIYGATARTDFPGIFNAINSAPVNMVILITGAVMLLVGLGYKIAAVPFHMWAPDVYQGAPSPVSAFMSVAVKAAGFAALVRILVSALPGISQEITPILWGLAALTMLVGNVVAISQKNIKRLLAYSSIAHAGYILMALVPFGQKLIAADVVGSALFYLVAYGITSFGAWAVVIALEKAEGKGLELEDYAGLGRKYPWLGAAMAVFMLSFTGVPLTLGFWGKFYLFQTAVNGGFTMLALIGLLTSLVSAFYYLRVVVLMFMRSGEPKVERDPWLRIAAIAAAVLVVGLSFFPGYLLEIASKSILLIQ
ncbi:MAG: NADH-quinone oxidoreductase subunit N [Anaerolineaceae bacterium]|nr:NADH-quinone oxidoreductase subunit N [Anaerolineaceae bacterium]